MDEMPFGDAINCRIARNEKMQYAHLKPSSELLADDLARAVATHKMPTDPNQLHLVPAGHTRIAAKLVAEADIENAKKLRVQCYVPCIC